MKLRHDGYRLITVRRLSGSSVYKVQPVAIGSPADEAISQALADFDPDTVHARWTQALDHRDTDPAGAITLARTLLATAEAKRLLRELQLDDVIRGRGAKPSDITFAELSER